MNFLVFHRARAQDLRLGEHATPDELKYQPREPPSGGGRVRVGVRQAVGDSRAPDRRITQADEEVQHRPRVGHGP